MNRFFALLAVGMFTLVSALPVSANETVPTCASDTLSTAIGPSTALQAGDVSATIAQDVLSTLEPKTQSSVQERTTVAGLYSWFVWCPSLHIYTCPSCCPPIVR